MREMNRKERQECAKDAINRFNIVFLHEILSELSDKLCVLAVNRKVNRKER